MTDHFMETMFTNISRVVLLAGLILLLSAGCAGRNVLDVSMVDSSATPEMVRRNFTAYQGRTVQWGGLIVDVINNRSPVLMEILSYPLDRYGNPEESYTATGRFFVELSPGLGQDIFRVGRYITVVGSIVREMEVRAGEAGKRLPVLSLTGVHVWDSYRRERHQARPVFSFGLGVRL